MNGITSTLSGSDGGVRSASPGGRREARFEWSRVHALFQGDRKHADSEKLYAGRLHITTRRKALCVPGRLGGFSQGAEIVDVPSASVGLHDRHRGFPSPWRGNTGFRRKTHEPEGEAALPLDHCILIPGHGALKRRSRNEQLVFRAPRCPAVDRMAKPDVWPGAKPRFRRENHGRRRSSLTMALAKMKG